MCAFNVTERKRNFFFLQYWQGFASFDFLKPNDLSFLQQLKERMYNWKRKNKGVLFTILLPKFQMYKQMEWYSINYRFWRQYNKIIQVCLPERGGSQNISKWNKGERKNIKEKRSIKGKQRGLSIDEVLWRDAELYPLKDIFKRKP